jgi:hypothetical protein
MNLNVLTDASPFSVISKIVKDKGCNWILRGLRLHYTVVPQSEGRA